MNSNENHSPPDFLVHDEKDSVGVIVVEDASAGKALTGWIMETNATIQIDAVDDIPLGHKIALVEHSTDDKVIKYGFPIGKVVAPIVKGGHLHVHNAKTEKW